MTQHDLPRIAAELSLDLHPLGRALIDCATHLADMSDVLPPRGDARHEYDELVAIIAYITELYRNADERLTQTAFLLQHAADVPHPLPLSVGGR